MVNFTGVEGVTDLTGGSVPTLLTSGGGAVNPRAATPGSGLATAGLIMSVFGAVNSAIGGYFAAKSQQNQLKSQALTMQFQSDIAGINAKLTELQAQQTLLAGQRAAGVSTMKAGQLQSAAKARMAASGVVLGEGSAREIEATNEYMKQVDALTINANTVRAAEAARIQKVNLEAQQRLQALSAGNLAATAETISPFSAGFTNLLSGAGSVASTWYQDKANRALYSKLGTT